MNASSHFASGYSPEPRFAYGGGAGAFAAMSATDIAAFGPHAPFLGSVVFRHLT
jgi:hypothetical protein